MIRGKAARVECPYRIRPYKPGDELEINAAFNRIFRKARTLEEWNWKFGRGAALAKIELVVDERDSVISHYGCQLTRFLIEGREYSAGHFVDSFSKRVPRAVREGWFALLKKGMVERLTASGDMQLLYGFPSPRVQRHGSIMGVHINESPIAEWTWEGGADWKPGKSGTVGGIRPSEVDRLWALASQRHRFAQMKTGKWFAWRFQSRVGGNAPYVFLAARRGLGRNLEAWAVILREEKCVRWVDLEWDGRNTESLDRLAAAAESLRRKWDVPEHRQWLIGDERMEDWLRSCGWMRRELLDGPLFSYRTAPPLELSLLKNLPCRLTGGDTDLF